MCCCSSFNPQNLRETIRKILNRTMWIRELILEQRLKWRGPHSDIILQGAPSQRMAIEHSWRGRRRRTSYPRWPSSISGVWLQPAHLSSRHIISGVWRAEKKLNSFFLNEKDASTLKGAVSLRTHRSAHLIGNCPQKTSNQPLLTTWLLVLGSGPTYLLCNCGKSYLSKEKLCKCETHLLCKCGKSCLRKGKVGVGEWRNSEL